MIQLEKFKNYLSDDRDISKQTVQSYIKDVESYILFLQNIGLESSLEATNEDVLSYINELENIGRCASTIMRKVVSIRAYYRYCICIGEINLNPTDGIKTEKTVKNQTFILSSDEVNSLLAQPNILDFKGYRDKAMLETLYATGIRVSELIDLNIEDVNLELCLLNCQNSKNKRDIPICKSSAFYISNYINEIRPHIIKSLSQKALFVNLNGNRLTRQGFSKIVKLYAKNAEIDKEITPHMLRYSFALRLLEDGTDIQGIKQIMGHANLSSTQNYIDIINSMKF